MRRPVLLASRFAAPPLRRWYSVAPGRPGYEEYVGQILAERLQPTSVAVKDVSGGCGSMFAITVVSPRFSGLPMVRQHKLVNEALKDEIPKWHGLQLQTSASANSSN